MARKNLALFFIVILFTAGAIMSADMLKAPKNDSRVGTTVDTFSDMSPFTVNYAEKCIDINLHFNSVTNEVEHEPFLMFNKCQNPVIEDMPYIWGKEELPDKVRVTFNVSLSSPKLRTKISEHIIRPENYLQYQSFLAKSESSTIPPDKSTIPSDKSPIPPIPRREKVSEFTLYFIWEKGRTIIGSAKCDNMQSYSEIGNYEANFNVYVDFTPSNWKLFMEKKDEITVIPYYALFRSKADKGSGVITGSIDVVKILNEDIKLDESRRQCMFLDEINEIEAKIRSKITATFSANDPDILNILIDNKLIELRSQLFEQQEITYADLMGNPVYQTRFAEHIKPLIENYRKLTNTDIRLDTGQSDGKSNVGTGTQESSTESDIKSTQVTKDTFNQKFESYGTQCTISKDGKYLVPAKIKIYSLKKGVEKISAEQRLTIQLTSKLENCIYVSSSPVPLAVFPTNEIFGFAPEPSSNWEPVGTIRLFIGKTIPPGWVEWKKGEKFPNHDQIPEELRDQEFPDLSGFLLGVGTEEQRGQLVRATVKELKPLKRTRLPYYEASAGTQIEFIYDPKYEFDPNQHRPNYLQVRLIIKVRE